MQNAVNGGVAQAQRTFSSNNLTEFGQNATTGAELLRNLPPSLFGDLWKQDSRSA